MIIATAGHIDHGKTALIKALTGIDTTHLPEEHRRGMTIDLGFASLSLAGGQTISFVDVPGHERFVRTMLAGVGGIDTALLVVAGDEGAKPQTLEHLLILDLLKIPSCVVAITKRDAVSAERIAEVERALLALFDATHFERPPIFAVDALGGAGVDALREYLIALSERPLRPRLGTYFRMPIDRSFTKVGAGLIVTGTVASGHVRVGDQLEILPTRKVVRVRGVQTHSKAVDQCGPGERCALNIAGQSADQALVGRGDWIVAPDVAVETTRLGVAFQMAQGAEPRASKSVYFCHGTKRTLGRFVPLNAADGSSAKFAHVILSEPVHALVNDRFILRNGADTLTVAGGVVLDPFAPEKRYGRPERAAALAAHGGSDATTALQTILRGTRDGVDLRQYAQAWNLDADGAAALEAQLDVVRVGSLAVDRAQWDAMQTELMEKLSAAERQRPEGAGLLASTLIGSKRGDQSVEIRTAALDALVRDKRLVRDGAHCHLPRANLSEPDLRLWRVIAPWLERRPPTAIHTVSLETGMTVEQIDNLLRRAMRVDLVRRIHSGRYFMKAEFFALLALAETLSRASPDGAFTTAEFRDRSSLGRNLTIELLEHFDRIKLTRRIGDKRTALRLEGSSEKGT